MGKVLEELIALYSFDLLDLPPGSCTTFHSVLFLPTQPLNFLQHFRLGQQSLPLQDVYHGFQLVGVKESLIESIS
jgi:hypothetical protein